MSNPRSLQSIDSKHEEKETSSQALLAKSAQLKYLEEKSIIGDLDILIPDNFLTQLPEEKTRKRDKAGILANLILDISRPGKIDKNGNASRNFYLGNLKTKIPNEYLFTEMPSQIECDEVLSKNDTTVSQGEKIQNFINFLKHHLTEKGLNKLLEIYNQFELNYHHVLLSELTESKNTAWSDCRVDLHIKYTLEDDLVIELRVSKMQTRNMDNMEGSNYYLFYEDVILGVKSTFKLDGTVTRELYTSSEKPELLRLIVDFKLQNYINQLKIEREKTSTSLFYQKPLSEYNKLKALVKRHPELLKIILDNSHNLAKMIETAVDIQIKIIPQVIALNIHLQKIRNQLNKLLLDPDLPAQEEDNYNEVIKTLSKIEINLAKNFSLISILTRSSKEFWTCDIEIEKLNPLKKILNDFEELAAVKDTQLSTYRGIL